MTTASRDAALGLAGEQVILMAEHALYWPAATTLFVADAHFGKAATFRAGGIFVPPGTTTSALARLDGAVARMGATRLIFLGDLLHAREGRSPETLRLVTEWRASRPQLEAILVRGNHDRSAGDPPESLGIACVDAPMLEEPFAYAHHPRTLDGSFVLTGHVHPAVRLRGPGRQYERLPCFWIRPTMAVLPAFGDFTGLGDIELEDGDRVFVVADGSVVSVALGAA
ncbi:MAG: ligase-associated DNA damage response endonuclease PdeM [Gemmatimonadaceae bacterium]